MYFFLSQVLFKQPKFHAFSQAAVYSLLQAASEISSRGDSRDRDINVFVQRR